MIYAAQVFSPWEAAFVGCTAPVHGSIIIIMVFCTPPLEGADAT